MTSTCNSSHTLRLLQRPVDRDPQALAELFARHRERLRKMVRLRLSHRLRNRFDSSSVLQQVYLDVTRRVGEYLARPEQPFFLWLRAVAGQRLSELHRQYLGPGEQPHELTLYRGALPAVNSVSLAAQLLGDRASAPGALRAEMMIRLQDALNGMDPLDREVLALCHFEELTDDETAAVLGIDKAAAPSAT
jgi:RNA polymerase sigma-70 factor (ECF subfamily)